MSTIHSSARVFPSSWRPNKRWHKAATSSLVKLIVNFGLDAAAGDVSSSNNLLLCHSRGAMPASQAEGEQARATIKRLEGELLHLRKGFLTQYA
eukprot:1157583-Pelagomonas_calceolata.AAC.4